MTFDTAELVNPERDKNREARFTIGTQLSTALEFLKLDIDLFFYEVTIGPVFSVSFDLAADTDGTLLLEKDIPVSGNRTEECIHECALPGHAGCYSMTTTDRRTTAVTLHVDLYFKQFNFAPFEWTSTSDPKDYYNSLEHGTGLLEGECPYKLYRVPVEVRYGTPESWIPGEGYSVVPSMLPDEAVGLKDIITGVTDATGNAAVYLPYRPDTRYTLVASNQYNDAGFGVQPHDIRKSGNEKVIIYVTNLDHFTFLVRKTWEIDGEEQDKPADPPLFVIQELNQDTGEWEICTLDDGSPAVITLTYLNRVWQGTGPSLPMWLGNGTERTIRQYRVRELAGSGERVPGESYAAYTERLRGQIVYDRSDPERAGQAGDPTARYSIPAYLSAVTGELVPEHETEYRVRYESDYGYQGNVTVDVTNTAIEKINVYKLWDNVPEEEKPERVYAALQVKPAEGWENEGEAAGIMPVWHTAADVLSGPTLSLNDLIAAGALDVEVPRLKDKGFAIAELTAENGWSASYVVRIYEKGIPLMWQAAEMDDAIADTAIVQEYGFSIGCSMARNEEFVTIPGKALRVGNDGALTAAIVNTKKKTGCTIGGVKYWPDSALEDQVIPGSVDIVVIDPDTGEEAGRVTVSGPTGTDELQMWPWTLTGEDLSPEVRYEIREELPAETAGKYLSSVYGYDVINTWIGDPLVDIRIRKLWDPLYIRYAEKEHGEGTALPSSLITYTIAGVSHTDTMSGRDAYEWYIPDIRVDSLNDLYDPAKFRIEETGIPRTGLSTARNSRFIPVYSGPELTFEDGKAVFTFTVTNMLQLEYDISDVYKSWDFGPYSEGDVIIPASITIELLRNGEPMGEKVTSGRDRLYDYSGRLRSLASLDTWHLKQETMWRLDPDGRLYRYTIRETMDPERLMLSDESDPGRGGYICTVSMYNAWDETGLRYNLTNRWIPGKSDDEFVTVRGTKTWKPEPWPANGSFRPDHVGVYILDSNDEMVALADCEYDYRVREWVWSVEDLPRYDENGDEIPYHILEKHTDGYVAYYDQPVFDGDSLTWTCDMENRLAYIYTEINKRIMDGEPNSGDTFTFRMTFIGGFSESDFGAPKLRSDTIEVTGEGTGRFEFMLNGEGVFLYMLEELDTGDPKYRYDTTPRGIFLVVTRDNDGLPKGELRLFRNDVVVGEDETFEELLARLPHARILTFVNYIQDTVYVEKKWEIDLEDKDRPDTVDIAVQKKVPNSDPERWETVATGKLKAADGWKAEIGVPKPSESNPAYRVRELDAERNIVYAPGDPDKPAEEEAGFVTFHVPEYESVLNGGTVSGHDTRYQVSYGMDENTYTITNTAVTAVDVKKHWILLSEEEDQPESAWVGLLAKPAADAVENAQSIPGADLTGLEDAELPVFNPVSGGINPVNLVTELALGVSADVFGAADGLTVAIAEVSEENSWTARFVDRKYTMGIPVEYTGAELGSEIVRQVIKYATGFNLSVTYNPFDNYISIPGKAYRTFAGWGLGDLDSSLLEKLVKAGRTLTAEDLDKIRPEDALLSDIQLQANVINVQIDIDNPPEPDPDNPEDPVPLTGVKRWKNDQEENRPETLTIRIREKEKNDEGGHDEVEGSPVTLNKSSFPGQSEWTWTLSGENIDGNKEYEINEEYPEGFANRDHYTGEVVDTEIINIWHEEEITTVRVSGQKTWDDNDNKAKKRPERLTVELLADGQPATRPKASGSGTEPVKPVETSEEGAWKYFFTDLPRYKTVDGEKQEIRYSVKEKEIEGYTVEYADPAFDETTRNWDCDISNKLSGYASLKIEKKWDIDIENKDHPKSIEVLVQKKTGDGDDEKWETVELVELKEDKDWKHECYLPAKQKKEGSEDEEEDIVYRVRELKGDGGILKMLQDKVNEYAGQVKEKFDEWINDIKTNAKELFDSLPDPLKNAANENFDKLAEELDAKENQVYKKLLEKLQFYSAEKRIVYDKDDKDKPKKKDDDDKEPETNIVTFKVEEYESVLTGEKVDAHETKYKVKYKKDDGAEGEGATYSIGNQAILETDIVKRWIMLGNADDDDKPDSVWLVLLFKLDEDIVNRAGSAGADLSSYTDIELPVFNLLDGSLFTSGLIEGGMNPITMVSELIAGVDIDVFNLGDKLVKIAVARVGEDDDWKAHFVTSKYMFGIPVEFKGAELSSEIIRQVIKYILRTDLSFSYTPFGNYISIPGKAYGNLVDVNQISDLFDLDDSSIAGKLAGEVLDFVIGKLNDLIKEIAPDGLPIGLDDWEQVSNVINVKIGIDWPETVSGRKIWSNDREEDRPAYLTINVKKGGEIVYTTQINKDNDWSWSFSPSDDEEEEDGEDNDSGGDSGDSDEDYTVEEVWPDDYPAEKRERYTLSTSGYDLINTWDGVTIAGNKIWKDDGDRDGLRPETLTIRLLADGEPVTREVQKTDPETGETTTETEEVTVVISAQGEWKYSFPNRPKQKTGENGQKVDIVYTVEETEVPEGYTVSGGTKEDGWDLTNTHEPETLDEITVKKVWDDDDDRDGLRPEKVSVILLANGATPTDLSPATATDLDPATPMDLSEENSWEYTYTDLYKYEDGEEIEYTVDETEVPEGYEKTIDGFTITNKHESERIDVTVKKKWDDLDDADGLRPESVKIVLLANGATPTDLSPANLATPTDIGEAEEWEHTFTGVLKYHEGEEIEYTADEEEVPDGYEKAIDGLTVTNSHEFEKITVTGKKVWDDADNQDGIRPDEITVILLADGEKVDEKTVRATPTDLEPATPTDLDGEATPTDLDEDDDGEAWTFAFEDLPKNKNGEPINYTVDEVPVTGYQTMVTGDMENGFTITNTHIPDTVTVSGTKIWDDADDQDGKRPKEILVNLFFKGALFDRQSVTADREWKYNFANIPKFWEGEEAEWSVREQNVPEEYTVSYSEVAETGENSYSIDITNTYVPEVIDVTVSKTWDDDDDRDGIRPSSVKFYLYADGTKMEGKEATLNDATGWEYTFTGVPKYAAGKEITYSAYEDPVPGYTMIISGTGITNTHTPETVTISGRKYWDDSDNHDGLRPEEITVILSGNDREIQRQVVTAGDGWAWSFIVPRYENGAPVSYMVSEVPVPGYTMTISGYDITNTHVPERITISGEKSWDDRQNQDGIRPDSIVISLYGDGARLYTRTIRPDENGDWKYSFQNMPRYRKGGGEVVYSIAEETVSGYYFIPSGMNITNVHVPETMTIEGEKFWDDDEDRDAIRPESITVTLSADGKEPMSQTVTADEEGRWRYTFYNVPVYDHGERISWTVTEDPIPEGYYMVISGLDITNVHVPEKLAVRGTKLWVDHDNRDGFRPEQITVILLADGEEIRRTTVTAADGWRYSFNGLDRQKDGRDIVYTVDEAPVNRYQKSINRYDITNTVQWAKYTVEWYYQENGVYPETPNAVEERIGIIGETAEMTDADRVPGRERYAIDEKAPNVFSATVQSGDPTVLKVYFSPYYIITYDPNGGRLDSSTEPVSTTHLYGEVITIREAPVRTGYIFLYWEGSRYDPGDSYTVTEDHTFVAQWEKDVPPGPDPGPGPDYKFSFTKKWSGATGDSINWTTYGENGNVVHKKFNKKVVSSNEWRYEAWFYSEEDYYVVEDVPAGFKVRYENTGRWADVTDRCYNGGTIINYKVPKTGDNTHLPLWTALTALGLLGAAFTVLRVRRRRR